MKSRIFLTLLVSLLSSNFYFSAEAMQESEGTSRTTSSIPGKRNHEESRSTDQESTSNTGEEESEHTSSRRRTETPEQAYQRAILGDKNLAGVNFQDADLRSLDLTNVDLSGANLKGAKINGNPNNPKPLYRTNLSGADLTDADLSCTKVFQGSWNGTIFNNTNLHKSQINGTEINKTKFHNSNLIDTSFSHVTFKENVFLNVNCQGIRLNGVCFSKSFIGNTNMENANIDVFYLNETVLFGVNFKSSQIQHIEIQNTNTFGINVNFENAIISYGYFKGKVYGETERVFTGRKKSDLENLKKFIQDHTSDINLLPEDPLSKVISGIEKAIKKQESNWYSKLNAGLEIVPYFGTRILFSNWTSRFDFKNIGSLFINTNFEGIKLINTCFLNTRFHNCKGMKDVDFLKGALFDNVDFTNKTSNLEDDVIYYLRSKGAKVVVTLSQMIPASSCYLGWDYHPAYETFWKNHSNLANIIESEITRAATTLAASKGIPSLASYLFGESGTAATTASTVVATAGTAAL